MATSAPKSGSKNSATEAPAGDAPKPKKSKKKLILILIITLILLGGIGGGAWWYFMGNADNAESADGTGKKKGKAEKVAPPVFVVLEQFTVNLQADPAEHFLQTAITLQVTAKEDVDFIKLYMPQIRSRILLLLTSKKASDLSTPAGKNKLSEEIMAQVNLPLTPDGKTQSVSNVFFTSFVIQ